MVHLNEKDGARCSSCRDDSWWHEQLLQSKLSNIQPAHKERVAQCKACTRSALWAQCQ